MEVSYRCNTDDYAEAQHSYAKKTAVFRICLVLAAICALGALYLVVYIDIFEAALLGLVAGLWTLPRLLYPWRIRRDFNRHPNLSRVYKLKVDTKGLNMNSETSQLRTLWAGYTGFRETANLFLIFSGARMFIIIPKRAFTPGEMEDFQNLLQNNLRTV
jgi:hypothetical protein